MAFLYEDPNDDGSVPDKRRGRVSYGSTSARLVKEEVIRSTGVGRDLSSLRWIQRKTRKNFYLDEYNG